MPLGIITLASAIPDMGALLVLSLKSNNLRAAGGKALAEGLKGNQVITELNIAGNCLGEDGLAYTDTSGVIALADVIPDMGALSVLNLASNNLGGWNGTFGHNSRHDTSGNTYDQCSPVCIIPYCFMYPCRHYCPCQCHP
jgi:hypothetical protein